MLKISFGDSVCAELERQVMPTNMTSVVSYHSDACILTQPISLHFGKKKQNKKSLKKRKKENSKNTELFVAAFEDFN